MNTALKKGSRKSHRCPNCGANLAGNKCEYCGTVFAKDEPAAETAGQKSPAGKTGNEKPVAPKVIAVGCLVPILVVVAAFVVMFIVAIVQVVQESALDMEQKKEQIRQENMLPYLIETEGTVENYNPDGSVILGYGYRDYETKILDEELLTFLNENNKSITGVDVLFTTDQEGQLTELYLASAPFHVVEATGDGYICVRGGQFLTIRTEEELDSGFCYEGYLSYPDMEVKQLRDNGKNGYSPYGIKCEDKRIKSKKDLGTGEDVSAYQILTNGEWLYCDKATYEATEIEDDLGKYTKDSANSFLVK